MDKVSNIMILGYGSAGSKLLDMCLHDEELCSELRFSVVSRNVDQGKINLSIISGGICNNYPEITTYDCDYVNNSDTFMEILCKEEPDIIVYTGRFMSHHKYGEYSYPYEIGYGVWTPMSAAPVYEIMKVVFQYNEKRSYDHEVKVINTSYADAVNPWLDSAGLSPHTGVGNLNHLIPRIKYAVKKLYNISVNNEDIHLYGSHYLNTYVSKEGSAKNSSYSLSIDGIFDLDCDEVFKNCNWKTSSGPDRNIMIASDCYALVKAMHKSSKSENYYEKIHLPGPLGLPGGYPCIIRDGCVSQIEGMEFCSDKILLNESSLLSDGVSIGANGYLEFTEYSIKKMKEVYDIDYPSKLHIRDAKEFATKISEKLITVR